MNSSETTVVDQLMKYGLRCVPFPKQEKQNRKTPDYRVFKGDDFSFFCEIKEIAEDTWQSGLRPDPIFNRLTDDIHNAVRQFNSVNPTQEHPNVLAFVNNDRMCGSLDLVGVLTGHLLTENGVAPIYLKYSNGRIKDDKNQIHLFLWFDSFKANKIFFNSINKIHFDRLCVSFGFRPEDIKTIGTH